MTIEHSCDILSQIVAALCPFPKILPEAELKEMWINFVDRGDLKQLENNVVMWLFVIILMQVHNERGQWDK